MARTANELVEQNPGFFNNPPAQRKLWKSVTEQAATHMQRDAKGRLLKDARPNESDNVLSYRLNNIRNLTTEGVDQFITTVSRSISSAGIEPEEMSDALGQYLESKPYFIDGVPAGWKEYFYEYLLRCAIADPNAILVDLPVMKETPELSPHYYNPTNTDLSISTFVVPSEKIVFKNRDVFSWKGGEILIPVDTGKDMKTAAEWFYICDRYFYYTYKPTHKDRHGKVHYLLEEWYQHDTGFEDGHRLPLNGLMGIISQNNKTDYKESLIRSFFEYADEFDTRFTNSQATDLRFAFPKMSIDPIACPVKGCNSGVVISKDSKGKPTSSKCTVCDNGVIKDPTPFGMLVKEKGIDGTINPGPGMAYITPDSAILEYAFKTPFEILERGYRSIGLNLIGSTAESGEAKKERLRIQTDIVRGVTRQLFNTIERHLINVECILNVTRAIRVRPRIFIPKDIKSNDLDVLAMEAKNAVASDKANSILKYVAAKYESDPAMVRVYRLAFMWSPLLAFLDDPQLLALRLTGAYTARDLAKADHAVLIFTEIANEDRAKFMDAKQLDLFNRANEMLIALIGKEEKEMPIINASGEVLN